MNSTPKPGDFPIGSVESRAAMRAVIEEKKRIPKNVRRIILERDGVVAETATECGPGEGGSELHVILERIAG